MKPPQLYYDNLIYLSSNWNLCLLIWYWEFHVILRYIRVSLYNILGIFQFISQALPPPLNEYCAQHNLWYFFIARIKTFNNLIDLKLTSQVNLWNSKNADIVTGLKCPIVVESVNHKISNIEHTSTTYKFFNSQFCCFFFFWWQF